jgi:hypothetical protein
MSNIIINIRRVGLLFSVVLLFNFIFLGVIASYFNLSQLYWFGALLPLILVLSYSARLSLFRTELVFLWIWFAYLFINWLVITNGLELKMIAIKDYLIPTITLFFLSRLSLKEEQLNGLYSLMRLIIFFQPVFLLHQFYFLAHQSERRLFDWDLISGTFGFNPDGGGGNSSGLLLYLCFYSVIAISRIRFGLKNKLDIFGLIICLFSIFMMEAKFVIVLLFFIVLSLARKKDLLSVTWLVKVISLSMIILGALLISYNANFSTGTKEGRALGEYITDTTESYFEEDVINFETGEVSRQAGIKIWVIKKWSEKFDFNTVFGFGLTSSKFSNSENYDAVAFGSYINFASTQAVVYFWDVGIFGVIIVFILLTMLLRKLLTAKVDNVHKESFRRGGIFLCLSAYVFPFYSSTLHINVISFTLFSMIFIVIGSLYSSSMER